jgi:PII-like signaling protein
MDTLDSLTKMARIEVVVEGEHVPIVRDLLLEAGATGYTALHGVAGFGHSGERSGRLLFNDRNSLSMIISVTALDQVQTIVSAIRELLDEHHGVVFVSETHVSRPEYFRSPGDASDD